MKLRTSRWKYLAPRVDIEGSTGLALFQAEDAESCKFHLEYLGRVCAEAWHDDLPEADRAWAEAHRAKLGKWVNDPRHHRVEPKAKVGSLQSRNASGDREFAPPWPMLLEAVKSVFLAIVEVAKDDPAPPWSSFRTPDCLYQTYVWRMLTADDSGAEHRPELLRAFQRGFRRGRRGEPNSLTRSIPPMLDAPRRWYPPWITPHLPGPSAARNGALWDASCQCKDRKEYAVLKQELRELYASAWRDDLPEEDREWAESYRYECRNAVNRHRTDVIAQSAYEGYLQSSDGLFHGEPARPWPNLTGKASEPWRSFVDRVEDAPEGESELAIAEAAVREYWDTLYKEAPPWDSDPAQVHWLAAVRAVRAKALEEIVPPARGY